MNGLKSFKLSQLGFAIVCGCAIAFLVVESKRLKNTHWAAIGGLCGATVPYIIKYVEDRIKAGNQQLKEQFLAKDTRISKLEIEVNALRTEIDRRVDIVESEIPRINNIVLNNKESVNGAINSGEQLRGEIFSARGEAQNAGKIAELALNTAQSAQDRINYILTSGSLINVANQVTKHEIKIAILERRMPKNGKDISN